MIRGSNIIAGIPRQALKLGKVQPQSHEASKTPVQVEDAVSTLIGLVKKRNISYHTHARKDLNKGEEEEQLNIYFSNDLKEIQPALKILEDLKVEYHQVTYGGVPINKFKINIDNLIEKIGLSNFAAIIEDADNKEVIEVRAVKKAISEELKKQLYGRD